MVNQSTLHGTLFTFVLMCVLVGPQSRVLAQISQEADIPRPLPVTGYDFANSGNDVYGEYDLTLYEDAEIVYDPQRGPVLQLGGTGYAISEQADLNVAEGFSVCLWVKVSPDCPENNFLLGQGFGSYLFDYSFYLLKRPRSALMWLYEGNGGPLRHTTRYDDTDISDGLWHHVAVSHDAELGYSSIYVNGNLQSTTDNIGSIENKLLGLFVGYVHPDSYGKGNRLPFIGRLDDIGFYNTVLTELQIQQIMINGLAGYNPDISIRVSPEEGDEFTNNTLILQWQAGRGAVSHNVYLSHDIDAVTTQKPETFLGTPTSTQLEVAGLKWATTYYWRVDEVNEAHEDSPWLGHIWSFRTLGTL
ncbi:MAG: LamG domain-containing protein, partial [Phycisphaeraceae bacterium]|nr:LamG domain-containing protein [Phycisphaeraceae bacterium]